MKAAIIQYIKNSKGIEVKSVSFSYYDAGRDPRERSYYSASATE